VLDAFEDWLSSRENHPLANDIEGANREDGEIASLIRHRQEQREAKDAGEPPQETVGESVAMLDARPGPISGGERFDTYDFDLINTGRAAARNAQAWITNAAQCRVKGELRVDADVLIRSAARRSPRRPPAESDGVLEALPADQPSLAQPVGRDGG
jgi:hypothetical protein